MYRLSREKKREQKRAARSAAASVAAPIAVHVPVPPSGPVDAAGDGAWASVGGVRVDSAPGEEIQQAVLNHLHRIALATGRPVRATVTDERIGYVVPLQVHGDGSSTFTAQPLRAAPGEPARPLTERATQVLRRPPEVSQEAKPPQAPASGQSPASDPSQEPGPAQTPDPSQEPAQPPQAVRGGLSSSGSAPTIALGSGSAPVGDGAAEPAPATPPGTAAAPTGRFGPPPVMDSGPSAGAGAGGRPPVVPGPPAPAFAEPAPLPVSLPATGTGTRTGTRNALGLGGGAGPAPVVDPEAATGLDPDPKPAPARGFDAVAEAVLGDDPRTLAGEGGAVLLAEPLAQVNEAVRAGRIEEAAALAERTVTEASGTLGAAHPEVLRVRELSAYIAYLAGDPLRAFALSLDLARVHLAAGDTEGAYGDVRGAATAWRAVRDPEEGLRLGRELIALWTELAAGDGPAADDIEELETVRARMDRLTERAERSGRAERAKQDGRAERTEQEK